MDQFDIKPGHYVVVIWDDLTTAESNSKLVQDIRAVTGSSGNVAMENIERLQLCKYGEQDYVVAFSPYHLLTKCSF